MCIGKGLEKHMPVLQKNVTLRQMPNFPGTFWETPDFTSLSKSSLPSMPSFSLLPPIFLDLLSTGRVAR
jgi:hypothetical protein